MIKERLSAGFFLRSNGKGNELGGRELETWIKVTVGLLLSREIWICLLLVCIEKSLYAARKCQKSIWGYFMGAIQLTYLGKRFLIFFLADR